MATFSLYFGANKGTYAAATTYAPGDQVGFGTPKGTYENILACTGISPTAGGNNANWICIAAPGATGSAGATGPAGPAGPAGATGPAGPAGAGGVGYDGVTSTTSTLIGTGNKTLTINKQGAFVVGQRVQLTNSAANYMRGVITAISAASVTVAVDVFGGSGTLAAWTVGLAGGDITNITTDPVAGTLSITTA